MRVPPCSWLSPAAQSPLEGQPGPELEALQAQTRLWFEQTQAQRLRAEGELPSWFHGFISRRQTEQLLQHRPLGCFLVRFSESTVAFVLSYRGRDRCRHFVLDQLRDGRYVILGERGGHAELGELLQHHTAAPLAPYREFLTVPCPRGDEPQGRAVCSPSSEAAANPAVPSAECQGAPGARLAAVPSTKGGRARRAPGVPPLLPAKSSSSAMARGLPSPTGSGAAPQGLYSQVHKEATPPLPPTVPDPKYQQLLCPHTYAEPQGGSAARSQQLAEPIPFYAMGRGSSPEENIYSEVPLARQQLPAPCPKGSQGAFATLPPRARPRRRLLRCASSQPCHRQLPAVPTAASAGTGTPRALPELAQGTPSPVLEFDEAVYGQRTSVPRRAGAGQEAAENLYEQLSGDHL
ncbi:SH2 domain-containing protein 2A [Colius striatus]|uniref:SH2 domain-containing protein 2A n=1 Tax=Colius striatus TaxID=57412 RepID=UPI002B1E2AA6|nr:SH2 domain-containing protein 2A [Colius striatus]